MAFNEDSRVKLPTILHLMRLGWRYLPQNRHRERDARSNIFPDLFKQALARINPQASADDIARLLPAIQLLLDNEDLGRAFFDRLQQRSGLRLIDFDNFGRNSLHVTTELPCENGDEVFRPDITLLINGLPLIFIEVKKPNNRDGILAERRRIKKRFANPYFRRFVNITQFMIFSNNMDYVDGDVEPLQGAFYASTAYGEPIFNYFREEDTFDLGALLKPLPDAQELAVLADNSYEVIRNNPDFIRNKEPSRPTNRICTSLLSRDRLAFVLRYGLAYVDEPTGLQKHIMRYPQLFATHAIARALDAGTRKGIIWHTQGSGKTALAYFNVRFLSDYFSQQGVIAKFYFIVDRLDLLNQAKREFVNRGLRVHVVNSKEGFQRDIRKLKAVHNPDGELEITVVNIQKFSDDAQVLASSDYQLDVQRVYFLDEVHRSYNPRGSFLANLMQSDRHAIHIGLTGTPLLGMDYSSRDLFGDYIHTYYYNRSIADGYTLRLLREDIQTHYQMQLQQAMAEIEVQMGSLPRKLLYAHPRFVAPMLDYVCRDFEQSRRALDDDSIGALVICDSAEQAREMAAQFASRYGHCYGLEGGAQAAPTLKAASDVALPSADPGQLVDAAPIPYPSGRSIKTAALILHDAGTKADREQYVQDFKAGKMDMLFVYAMLLTGFDAPRLKKLYLGRVIRQHGLLQALTRVNRPYRKFRYGYVVDFADIREEFEATNARYLQELSAELGDEMQTYSQLFKTDAEIAATVEEIKNILFQFDTANLEVFSEQISALEDRALLHQLKKVLRDARSLYNLIRLQDRPELLHMLDFASLRRMENEVSNHLALLATKESVEHGALTANLLNQALEDVVFQFTKVGEEELVLAGELQDALRRTREALARNIDPADPEFIRLKDELERLFKKKKLSEVTQQAMQANIAALGSIHRRVKALNLANARLRQKYRGDEKYARMHKRLRQRSGPPTLAERQIHAALMGIKQAADQRVLDNTAIVQSKQYFSDEMMPIVIQRFGAESIRLDPDASRYINKLLVAEYLAQFNNQSATGLMTESTPW